MSAPRPTMALHTLKNKQVDANRLSTCKLCRCGIYKQQPHRWFRDPMGLSHEDCARLAGLL